MIFTTYFFKVYTKYSDITSAYRALPETRQLTKIHCMLTEWKTVQSWQGSYLKKQSDLGLQILLRGILVKIIRVKKLICCQ